MNETIGDAFFDEKGVQKEWLTAKGEAVVDYVNKSGVTQNFIQLLLAKELLAPQTLSLNLAGQEEYTLDGLYVINEQKLNDLSDSEFSELRKTNALPAIYAILMSMQCIKKLIDRQSSK